MRVASPLSGLNHHAPRAPTVSQRREALKADSRYAK